MAHYWPRGSKRIEYVRRPLCSTVHHIHSFGRIGFQVSGGILVTQLRNQSMTMAIFYFSSDSRVNWLFLLSMLLSKAAVFIVVLIFTMLVTRPMDLSKAGLFAIFCTQSNDFALGYPIGNGQLRLLLNLVESYVLTTSVIAMGIT